MWEKFKDKCKGFFSNRAVVILTTLILVSAVVIISVSVALNRSKKNPSKTPGEETTLADGNPVGLDTDDAGHYASKDTDNSHQAGADKSEQTGDVAAIPEKYALPVSGALAKEHDASIQVWSATTGDYRVHLGIDISAAADSPVTAAANGTVSKIWNDPMMGVCIALSHEGDTCTVYKNLSAEIPSGIAEGAAVSAGQKIGTIGDTAVAELADEPHLHFEMTVSGISVNPLDYLSDDAVKTLSTDTMYEDTSAAPGK